MRWTLAFLSVASLGAAASLHLASADEAPPARRAEVKLEFIHVELTGVEGPEIAAVATAIAAVPGVRSVDWAASYPRAARPVAGSTAPMMVRQPFAAHWAEVTQQTRRITATSPSISDEGTACNNEGEEDG